MKDAIQEAAEADPRDVPADRLRVWSDYDGENTGTITLAGPDGVPLIRITPPEVDRIEGQYRMRVLSGLAIEATAKF